MTGDFWRWIFPGITKISLGLKQSGHTGAMIAFMLDDSDSAAILSSLPPDIEAEKDSHITLLYLGKVIDIEDSRDTILAELENFAVNSQPITGLISGVGRFLNDEGNGTNAIYASFDSPELPAFRESLVQMIQATGIGIESTHGFTPHITLAYIPKDSSMPNVDIPIIKIMFSSIYLVWGDKHFEFGFVPIEETA